jgi:lysozyme
MTLNAKALFDAVREIKGRGLTQDEVDTLNRALGITTAAASREGMHTSPAGIALIHSFESLKLVTYRDPGSKDGKPITGGWGSTRDAAGNPFQLGFYAPREYWDRLFERDRRDVELGVNLLLAGAPTSQPQFDALVSFAYNAGLDLKLDDKAEGLGDSTLLRKHRLGNYKGAAAEFGKWIYNDGKAMDGLKRRRAAEAALYAS